MDSHPEIGIAGCRQVDGEGRLWPTVRRFPGVGRALGEAIGPERLPFLAAWLGETELDLSRYDSELSCDWTSGSFLLSAARRWRAPGCSTSASSSTPRRSTSACG